jgi:tetratricopeptide (TPR) repeat protein
MNRQFEDVVAALRSDKSRDRRCTLLMGAGVSVKAGIPTASQFVDLIRERHARAYDRAEQKTYPWCMLELTASERRDLIAEYVDKAQVNWAHIAVAQLMKTGYVDRILTTNFDPLVIRACALVGLFPAVYDFAASQIFNPGDLPDEAVFYLHGQRTGFVLINTPEDFEHHSTLLAPVFQEAFQRRVWLVIGYSGGSDPVFEHLAAVSRFDNGLYWVGFGSGDPPSHVSEKLLVRGKDAFYVSGYDADSFLVLLAQELKAFPPDFVKTPFDYLESLLGTLTPYTPPKGRTNLDVTERARLAIRTAASQYREQTAAELVGKAEQLLLAGDYEQLTALKEEYDQMPTPELASAVAWGFVGVGNVLHERAVSDAVDADRLLALAAEQYEKALEVDPLNHEALYNMATACSMRANQLSGEEADRLYVRSFEMFERALDTRPGDADTLHNWALALAGHAERAAGDEADTLYAQAVQKYAEADEALPEDAMTLENWGVVLSGRARRKAGKEAQELFREALDKFEAADALNPNDASTLANWGESLLGYSQTKDGEEAIALLASAREKLLKAEELSEGVGAYNLACASAVEGDIEECRRWLERCEVSGTLPSSEHLLQDTDLRSVRDLDWFRELVARRQRED